MFFSFFDAAFCNWLCSWGSLFLCRILIIQYTDSVCISVWYINTMKWFVKVNKKLKYAFLLDLSQWCFGDLTVMTLAIEDANSKLVDVVMLMLTFWRGRLVTANSLTTACTLFVACLGGYIVKSTQPLGLLFLWQCCLYSLLFHFTFEFKPFSHTYPERCQN